MERAEPRAGAEEPEPKFEAALARLEEIVHALESGHLSLDDSLRAFEEGTGLLRLCARKLEDVERRIEVLVRDESGLRTEPFRADEETP